jgi:hypothetical protein
MTPEDKLTAVMCELYEGITGLPYPPDCTETRYTEDKLRKYTERIIKIVEGNHESKEGRIALLKYWINERNHARDCRWTQIHITKDKDRHDKYNNRYKECDEIIKELRKELPWTYQMIKFHRHWRR